ncbi:F-box/LRR-repeat protein 20-like [Actinia tenebrosa]|uniref:F-box/LRR-repeat protein 20-like n=1 Tax=Actinia tenebrosa TaxID=6105 RepID=A0A6P8IF23_ACTTE|nr:F-box/LRR-repeat protein 20-like [Actinia tenebrosa]
MDKLPEVVILRILSHLDFDDLRTAARVNKQWDRIAFDPFLWRLLELRGLFLGHEGFSVFFDRIRDSVVCCNLRDCTGLSRDFVFKIVTECSRLKALSLQGCQIFSKVDDDDVIYSRLPLGIKYLDLRFIQDDDVSMIFSSLLPRMRSIEVLGMDHFHLPAYPSTRLLQSLLNLKVFYCQDCPSLIDDDLNEIASSCPNLEALSFAGCTCLLGKFLPFLIHACPRLRTLLLSCTRISNQYLMATDWARSVITELDISYCYSITEEGLLSLLPRLSQLNYLQISFCGWGRSLSDDVIMKMAEKNCTNLETLDIHSSFNLSEHALYGLLRNCPNMTTLCVGSAFNSEAELGASLRCLPKLKIFFITKQSAIRTEVLFNFIAKYCPDLEALALHNFYAISRSKVEVSLLNIMNKCHNFKTLCIRGTNVPLRTEMITIAGVTKIISGRRDIDIVRSSHELSVGPTNGLDNVMQAGFNRYRDRTL